MSITKYQVLLRSIELGSLTKAAEELGYTQSGVSHTIQNLEERFGFSLLNRSRSGISLTVEGEKLYPLVREMVRMEESIEQTAAQLLGLETGCIRLGTFTSISVHLLPRILRDFQTLYPNIEFQFREGDYQEIERNILDGEIECGFTSLPTQETLESLSLFKDKLVAVLPKTHRLSQNDVFPLSALSEEAFIMPGEGTNYNLGRLLKQHSILPCIKYAIKDDYVTLSMVKQGLGISILPELVIEDFRNDLCVLPLEEPVERTIGIACRAAEQLSPAVKRFLSFVQEWTNERA